MNALHKILLISVMMVIVDIPWLTLSTPHWSAAIRTIQGGREAVFRPWSAVIVYPAMAFLALRTESLLDAFLTGLAVQAVYDFTALAILKDYPLYLAVADSLWGGILYSAVQMLRKRFGF